MVNMEALEIFYPDTPYALTCNRLTAKRAFSLSGRGPIQIPRPTLGHRPSQPCDVTRLK
jgi:hypothetical protein